MHGYLRFSFWISIAPDMIYLSHIVIVWEKYFPLVGIVLKTDVKMIAKKTLTVTLTVF